MKIPIILLTNVIFVFFLSSCVGLKHYTNIVNQETDIRTIFPPDSIDQLEITFDDIKSDVNFVEKLKYRFIPAILYWEWNSTYKVELSSESIHSAFNKYLEFYYDSLGLENKLIDKRLDLRINDAPNEFLYENKGTTVFFVIAYSYSTVEEITTKPIAISIDYELKHNGLVKEDRIIINHPVIRSNNVWNGTRKFTSKFIDVHDELIKHLCEEIMVQLNEQI